MQHDATYEWGSCTGMTKERWTESASLQHCGYTSITHPSCQYPSCKTNAPLWNPPNLSVEVNSTLCMPDMHSTWSAVLGTCPNKRLSLRAWHVPWMTPRRPFPIQSRRNRSSPKTGQIKSYSKGLPLLAFPARVGLMRAVGG